MRTNSEYGLSYLAFTGHFHFTLIFKQIYVFLYSNKWKLVALNLMWLAGSCLHCLTFWYFFIYKYQNIWTSWGKSVCACVCFCVIHTYLPAGKNIYVKIKKFTRTETCKQCCEICIILHHLYNLSTIPHSNLR